MSDPTYQRTTGQRNKINKRIFKPVPLMDGSIISSTARYFILPNGCRVRMRKEAEGK